MCETGLNWDKLPPSRNLKAHIKRLKWKEQTTVITATNKYIKNKKTIWGGTAIILKGEMARRSTDNKVDESGLGRWVSTLINGKKRKTRIIMVYRPNKGGKQKGVYAQHERFLMSKNDNRDPLTAWNEDLEKTIIQHQDNNETVIVMGDFNSDIRKGKILRMCNRRNLNEKILLKHGKNPPATYDRNSKRIPIDGIIGSRSAEFQQSGYLGFGEGFDTDHRI